MTQHTPDQVLGLVCKAGKIMLESGSEIYRVEQTVSWLCRAFGIENCDCYATPTMLMVSLPYVGGSTRMLRIHNRQINLYKIAEINALSRGLAKGEGNFEQVETRLEEIEGEPPYPFSVRLLASAVGTGSFSILFGGGVREFLCSLIIGAMLRAAITSLTRSPMGAFMVNLVGGALGALMGWLAVYFGFVADWWIITLSALMLLVPGMLLTNAMQDIAGGELVSGTSRIGEAMSIAAALACGAAATLAILTGLEVPL